MKNFVFLLAGHTPLLKASAVVTVLFLVGCGGGGSGSPAPQVSPSPIVSPGASRRAAAIDGVKGARKAGKLFSSAKEVISRGASETSAGMSLARRIIVYAQQAKSKPTRLAGLTWDETTGFYYGVGETESGFRMNYYEDATGKTLAGYIEIKQVDERSIQMIFDLPKGQQPSRGTLTLVADNEEGTSGSMKGELTDPISGDKVVFDIAFSPGASEAETNISGGLSVSDADGTITFRNLVGSTSGSLRADINWNGVLGELNANADESGSLTLGTGGDMLRAEWNAAGAGRVTLPDGTVVNITDFDTADGEG